MAIYRIEESTLREMANCIRNITGKTDDIVVGNMSTEIITKTENLDGEITAQNTLISEQDAKIAELAEILSSKASGGSDVVETCTVRLFGYFYPRHISYTRCVNGVIDTVVIKDNTIERTLENVVCDSAINLEYNGNLFNYNKTSNITVADMTYVNENYAYGYIRVVISASGNGEFERYDSSDL